MNQGARKVRPFSRFRKATQDSSARKKSETKEKGIC